VPANHSLSHEDKQDGTYHVHVSTAMACVLRLFVNLDKNLPSNQGELPGITLHMVADPAKTDAGQSPKGEKPPPPIGLVREKTASSLPIDAKGSGGKSRGGASNDRFRSAAGEMMLGFGAADDRRDKDVLVVAAEAFAENSNSFYFDKSAAPTPGASRQPGLFDKSATPGKTPKSPKAKGSHGSFSAASSSQSGRDTQRS
jgi:hypothetical protein